MASCPICYEPYQCGPAASAAGAYLPKCLPCGHTVCVGCATRLHKKSGNNTVLCPKDNKSSFVASVDQLPTNFMVLELLESLKLESPVAAVAAAVAAAAAGGGGGGQGGGQAQETILCKDHNRVQCIYICVCHVVCVCVCVY